MINDTNDQIKKRACLRGISQKNQLHSVCLTAILILKKKKTQKENFLPNPRAESSTSPCCCIYLYKNINKEATQK